MKIVLLTLIFIFLISCSNNITGDVVIESKPTQKYPSFIDGCDRFRPIFQEELEKYSLLEETFNLPMIYALVYQESLCKTRDELKKQFEENKDNRETWKGGIMQVDQCWRGNMDCSTIKNEISSGMEQLNFAYSGIDKKLKELNLKLLNEDKIKLLLISYNRGYFLINDALELKEITNKVYVDCFDLERCSNNHEYLDVTKELEDLDDLDKALLFSCRKNYGLMKDSQGDYCTGEGYGLNYPKEIFSIYEKIINQEVIPKKSKEFYSKDIKFSGYKWLVKKSIGKTGPGPNYFYYDDNSVFIDEYGLHLNILERESKWYSSEVILTEQLGFGKYIFHFNIDMDNFHKNLVLGLFTYDLTISDDPEYYNREIDFEISRWGFEDSDNSQFTIQNDFLTKPVESFNLHNNDLIVSFDWQKKFINFTVKLINGTILKNWFYTGNKIPNPENEHARINLWVYGNPNNLKETEVIVKRFEFFKQDLYQEDYFKVYQTTQQPSLYQLPR